ncbi:MAG: DUF885 family protein [Proteobacteria bacterium]|nr:DUF885 family protein [Pseudomonadota bacterium]
MALLRTRLASLLAPTLVASTVACSSAPPRAAMLPVDPPAALSAPATPDVPAATAPPTLTDDQNFEAFAQRFLDEYLRRAPSEATQIGDHRYDATWPDVSVAGDASTRTWLQATRAELAKLPRGGLSEQNQIDTDILDDQLRFGLFALDELKARDTDPLTYTGLIGEGLDPLVTRSFGTKEGRMASLKGRLDGVAAIVAAAKARLAHPARIATETAIQQNKGLIALVETQLPARFAEVPALTQDLTAAAKAAATALRDLQRFLETDLLARSDGSFRLGRDKFSRKLAFALGDDIDIDAIAASAHALLAQTQAEMVDTARQIWSDDKLGKLPRLDTAAQRKAFVKQVLDHVAQDRPSNKTILADAKLWLDKATAFVRAHDLVRVPDEPIAIIEMPEYKRGVAVAYCDSSGPLEATQETFYAISPTPSDWTTQRVDSFYREYNQAMLADLSIHEAMPGHYLQIMHSNQFKSKIRAVFGSGPFVEGWAVYGEWLMAEKGFGGARVKLQRQKMVLRLAANTILDHDVHAGAMEEKAALALMKGEAFQEDGEAVGKWKRARLSSAQLTTYYYGFSELLKLRRAAEREPGFTERAYHDKLLASGSPAMKYVRRLMAKR